MIIRETLVNIKADEVIHPPGGRIYLLPPNICTHLYNGNSADLYITERRDLTALILGIMAMNMVTAKKLGNAYPKDLIDPAIWRPEYIDIARKLVFKTENGIESSLSSLDPANFIYLRVSNMPAHSPLLRIFYHVSDTSSTLKSCLTI